MCYSFSPHIFYFGKSLLNNFQESVVIQSVKALGKIKNPNVSGGLTVSVQDSVGIYLYSRITAGVCIAVIVDRLGKKHTQVLQGRVACRQSSLAELRERACFQCLQHKHGNTGKAKRKRNLSYLGVTPF